MLKSVQKTVTGLKAVLSLAKSQQVCSRKWALNMQFSVTAREDSISAKTDETVNKRTKAALAAGLKPIVCVGELLWERECDITEEVIARQIKLDLFNVTEEELKNVVIAYEPVWAIGTGKTATADQAEEVCAFIRATIAKLYNQAAADAVTIQYGGSMNDGNADELLSKTNVDGGLIGGASLVAEKFAAIVKAASK